MYYQEIRDLIFSYINKKKKNPKTILKIKNKIFEILNKNHKLFYTINEKDEKVPYIQIESGELVKIDSDIHQIQSLFNIKFGVDLNQNTLAKEILNFIKNKTLVEGSYKIINKFTKIKDNVLYVSCGPNKVVTFNEDNQLIKVKNGYNDIFFDSHYCLPEFNLEYTYNYMFDEIPDIYSNIKAFNINHYIPDGINIYSEEMQKHMLKCWIIGVLLKIKPYPILLFYGNKSSGKTLTSKAIMKLFLGNRSNVSIFPDNKRSLMSCITEHFIYTIDNLDSKVPNWFNDTLTLASTGGELSERALFSNATTFKKEIVSYNIITTRNGNFAKREDIKDRILPVFFEDRDDFSESEYELLKEIEINRDKLLYQLITEAQIFLNNPDLKFNHKYRFTNFGKLVQNKIDKSKNFTSDNLFKATINAQFNSLTDIDPLIQIILEFDFIGNKIESISGTPIEIIKFLEKYTKYQNNLKPRIISRKLKENKYIFELNGWTFETNKFGHTTKFNILPPNTNKSTSQ